MRRISQPVEVEIVKPPLWRRALLPLLLLATLAAVFWYFIWSKTQRRPAGVVAQATDVRSEVTRQGDSLEVAVRWQLNTASAESVPESIRVEVGLSDTGLVAVSTESAERRRDTLRIPTPEPGQTATGYSCVSAIHRGRLTGESCTPWQFVLPSADQAPDSAPGPPRPRDSVAAASTSRVRRVVVQPSGLQVDPDIEGRCATWQRRNPTRSVWVDINRQAIPECTGPNGKPTVAQFCAFAELVDGRKVITQNSSNSSYCDRLFQQWNSELIS